MEFVKKHKLVILIALLAIIGLGVYYFLKRKSIIKQKTERLSQFVSSSSGMLGVDVDSVLFNVTKDLSYTTSASDLLKMNSDDKDVIISALMGKNKPKIKAMVDAYATKYGESFNDHLNDVFSFWWKPYDTQGYQSVLNVIKNA